MDDKDKRTGGLGNKEWRKKEVARRLQREVGSAFPSVS